MVRYKIVKEIIEKCWTHAQIREELSDMSFEDRLKSLKDKNKLTQLEENFYGSTISNFYSELEDIEESINEYYEEYYEEYGEYPKKPSKQLRDEIEELNNKYNELFFKYDKRLYTDYELGGNNPIPPFDWSDYAHDDDGIEDFHVNEEGGFIDPHQMKISASRDSIGENENTQIIQQSENTNYTAKELSWLDQYFVDNRLSSFLTHMINGEEPKQYTDASIQFYEDGSEDVIYYSLTDKWKKEFNNIKYHLDNAIAKSNGLTQPTILYHAGRIDLSLLPGDKGVWKGYKSMTFQEQSMVKHSNINDDYWNVIVLAPTGTKGVCANDMRFHGMSFVDEHEYLLGRNTTYTVIDIDYETGTEIVMLD